MARLFFALWPGLGERERLAALARNLAARSAGRAVPVGKIHLTLAFLGEVDAGLEREIVALAPGWGRGPFELRLDRTGSFAHPGVAWIGQSKAPEELANLVEALRGALAAIGIPREPRPFKAHVTLVRRVGRPVEAEEVEPVIWRSTRFALVRSNLRTGRYENRGDWELRAR